MWMKGKQTRHDEPLSMGLRNQEQEEAPFHEDKRIRWKIDWLPFHSVMNTMKSDPTAITARMISIGMVAGDQGGGNETQRQNRL